MIGILIATGLLVLATSLGFWAALGVAFAIAFAAKG